jgi:outer membrane protein OmpA-like peptidoglycan-associated protein
MNACKLLASSILIAALPALAQEGPVLKEGQVDVNTLVDALTPKQPIRTRSIRIVRDDVGTPAVSAGPAKAHLLITFDTNSATLTQSARQSLDIVGQAMTSDKLSGARFAIEGHADPRGAAGVNQKLSQLRAQSVRDYLVSKLQIDRARLEAVGKGSQELMNKATPEAPENRRVTIVNLTR